MRILMLNNEFPPLGGGMGTVNQAMLQFFAGEAEFEIDLITSAGGAEMIRERFSERITINRIPIRQKNIHHAANSELIRFALMATKLSLRFHRASPYDLCFAWSAVPAGGCAYLLKKATGLPYIVRVCGPDIPGFEERYQKLYVFLNPVIRSIWGRSETVIAKCQHEADLIHAIDPRIAVRFVQNGVNLGRFQPETEKPLIGTLRLLCVARLIERKGQRQIIQAIHELKKENIHVELDLVGLGDAEDSYRAEARKLEVSDRVSFLGYIRREDIPQVYNAAHIFVLPSFNEGMSVAALEALSSGLPLLTTPTGGMEYLVSEGVNGFTFPWGDVKRLANLIRHCSEDRDLVQRMGVASREKAKQFSWNEAMIRYKEIFQEYQSHQKEISTRSKTYREPQATQ